MAHQTLWDAGRAMRRQKSATSFSSGPPPAPSEKKKRRPRRSRSAKSINPCGWTAARESTQMPVAHRLYRLLAFTFNWLLLRLALPALVIFLPITCWPSGDFCTMPCGAADKMCFSFSPVFTFFLFRFFLIPHRKAQWGRR